MRNYKSLSLSIYGYLLLVISDMTIHSHKREEKRRTSTFALLVRLGTGELSFERDQDDPEIIAVGSEVRGRGNQTRHDQEA
jgi:hypothetical protein